MFSLCLAKVSLIEAKETSAQTSSMFCHDCMHDMMSMQHHFHSSTIRQALDYQTQVITGFKPVKSLSSAGLA